MFDSQKNLSAKNSTPAVRCAYVALVSRAVRGGVAAAHAQALRPTLLGALERAAAQPLQVKQTYTSRNKLNIFIPYQ